MARLPGPIEDEICELAGIWSEHGNPAAAWRCFVLARENGFPVPEVIDAEILRFAQAVTAPLADKEGSITQKSVAAAWGIAAGHKPGPELRNTRRDIGMYFEYWDLRRGWGERKRTNPETPNKPMMRNDAISTLAGERNMPPKTIEGILDHFAKEYGPGDPFENPALRET